MRKINRSLLFAAAAICAASSPCFADDEEEFPPGTPLPPGYVRSIDVMNSGFATANSLELASEYAAMMHNYDQALVFAKLALAMDKNDLDVHIAYAQALQAKVDQSKDPDPRLFNECVREWLIVLRNEVGAEKGLNLPNGRGIGKLNKLYEDEEHSIPAAMHLKALVGRIPKAGESDKHFLMQACKPVELEVTGKVLNGTAKPADKPDPLEWMK